MLSDADSEALEHDYDFRPEIGIKEGLGRLLAVYSCFRQSLHPIHNLFISFTPMPYNPEDSYGHNEAYSQSACQAYKAGPSSC